MITKMFEDGSMITILFIIVMTVMVFMQIHELRLDNQYLREENESLQRVIDTQKKAINSFLLYMQTDTKKPTH